MLLSQHKNSKKQGDAGLGSAINWFTLNGYGVCIPLTDSQDYDLVVEINGELKKIQVKTTSHKKINWIADLRVKGGNRSGTGKIKKINLNEVDFVFVLTEDGTKYFIPLNEIQVRSTITLSSKYDRYKIHE